jgi:hypothetical protein
MVSRQVAKIAFSAAPMSSSKGAPISTDKTAEMYCPLVVNRSPPAERSSLGQSHNGRSFTDLPGSMGNEVAFLFHQPFYLWQSS